ncbi:Protein of unknown function [Micromonospora lupini str. Lupac 08]|uniref:Uncharacterized protein n=1 Tax=Micromonospora lupini str. Lupac 08 TaxID=1150864 RepID=I0KWT6_9ACTN|nr:Protein of unknown function [Micromonospora lupini str. Lupac 08]
METWDWPQRKPGSLPRQWDGL